MNCSLTVVVCVLLSFVVACLLCVALCVVRGVLC